MSEPWIPIPPGHGEPEPVANIRPSDYCVACGYPRPGRICPNCKTDQSSDPAEETTDGAS